MNQPQVKPPPIERHQNNEAIKKAYFKAINEIAELSKKLFNPQP